MGLVANGCRVRVHYTGRFEDGTVFDSSRDKEPLSFEVGKGMVIKGFEDALLGKKEGDTVTVTIDPEDAYGAYDDQQIFTVARAQVPEDIPVEIGTKLQLSSGEKVLFVTITDVNDEEITLDGNHELAGKTLIFEIEVLSVD